MIPTWLTAAATVVLAIVAGTEIVRNRRLDQERRRGYTAELHAHAFALRRQVQGWRDESAITGQSAAMAKATQLSQQVGGPEQLALAIVVAASKAETAVAESWGVYRVLSETTRQLRALTERVDEPSDPLAPARRSMERCLGYLDEILAGVPPSPPAE